MSIDRYTKEKESAISGAASKINEALDYMGLSLRERCATWDKVPSIIKRAMATENIGGLISGCAIRNGFGVGSDTGSGKTMAIAAMMKVLANKRILWIADQNIKKAEAGEDIPSYGSMGVKWVSWPDAVTWIRAHALDRSCEDLILDAESCRLLILDDLGRERIKGTYMDDWAASQLDRIVNSRYREMKPIVWTTNLREVELVSLYGAALVSRLCEDNPLTWVENAPSLRIK